MVCYQFTSQTHFYVGVIWTLNFFPLAYFLDAYIVHISHRIKLSMDRKSTLGTFLSAIVKFIALACSKQFKQGGFYLEWFICLHKRIKLVRYVSFCLLLSVYCSILSMLTEWRNKSTLKADSCEA